MSASHPSRQLSVVPAPDERRSAPRHRARLDARLRFRVSPLKTNGGNKPSPASDDHDLPEIVGRTRNLSETGLALALPEIRLGDQYLNVVGSALQIALDLPFGPVTIRATPVRCEPLAEGAKGYLIGVRIVEMDDREWVRYVQFLRSLL